MMANTATALQITMAVVATRLRSFSFFFCSSRCRCWTRLTISLSRWAVTGRAAVPVRRWGAGWDAGRSPVLA